MFVGLGQYYLTGAYLIDPLYDVHVQRAPAGAYRLRDVAPDAFQRSRYFTEHYEQTTMVDELAFVAYPAPGVSVHICLGRDACSNAPFSGRQIEACKRLAPIVAVLSEKHWSWLRTHTGPVDDVAERLVRAAMTIKGCEFPVGRQLLHCSFFAGTRQYP